MVNNPFASRLAVNTANKSTSEQNPFAKKLVFNKTLDAEWCNTEDTTTNATNGAIVEENEELSANISSTSDDVENKIIESTDTANAITSDDDNDTDRIPGEKINDPFVKPENPDVLPAVENETILKTEESIVTDNISETESIEETATEEQSKKRRRRKKAEPEAEENNTETKSGSDVIVGTIKNNSTIPFSKAIETFCSVATDDEWLAYKNDIQKTYDAITIPTDLNSAMMLNIICQLSNLRNRIWVQHQYYKNQYDAMSSREPEGVIERIKKLYIDDTASNDLQRKRAGIMACINYKTEDGEIVNLYDLFDEVRARYYFLNSIMSNIDFQKNLLITASSALKLENDLTTGE